MLEGSQPPPWDEGSARRTHLKRDILHYLLQEGPLTDYAALYLQFDPGMTGEMGPVLQELRAEESIEFKADRSLVLTEKGKSLLKKSDDRI